MTRSQWGGDVDGMSGGGVVRVYIPRILKLCKGPKCEENQG